jgi:hypothetical protein
MLVVGVGFGAIVPFEAELSPLGRDGGEAVKTDGGGASGVS